MTTLYLLVQDSVHNAVRLPVCLYVMCGQQVAELKCALTLSDLLDPAAGHFSFYAKEAYVRVDHGHWSPLVWLLSLVLKFVFLAYNKIDFLYTYCDLIKNDDNMSFGW